MATPMGAMLTDQLISPSPIFAVRQLQEGWDGEKREKKKGIEAYQPQEGWDGEKTEKKKGIEAYQPQEGWDGEKREKKKGIEAYLLYKLNTTNFSVFDYNLYCSLSDDLYSCSILPSP